MSYIISIEFLIFISIIPNSIPIETTLKFFFFNGFNVIRCSDDQVQVYEQNEESTNLFTRILNCDDNQIFHTDYAGYLWNELNIICSSTHNQVHEELSVQRKFDGNGEVSNKLPAAKGQLDRSKKSYELQVTNNDGGETAVIKSKDQPANDLYFKGDSKLRKIYIWFPNHPIICRIEFQGEQNNPCSSSETEQEVKDVDYACYYTPGAEQEPTIAEMIAEFKQIDEIEKPDNKKEYVLNLDRPEISADDSLDSDEDDDSKNPSNSNSNNSGKKKTSLPSNSPKNKKKSSIGKIIGLVFGILLLLCLIGGIAFYFIQKNRSILSSSSSVNIETGNNKGASVPVQNKSQQSLPHTGGMQNQPSTKDKPNIALQTAAEKKRQRAGTSMAINDDI